MAKSPTIHEALSKFADSVRSKMALMARGEPEAQLRAPFESLMADAGRVFGWNVACKDESPLPDRLGRPDYAAHVNGLLAGHIELKAPGLGADSRRFKGRNRDQWNRFTALPNILYTDGNEWALYRTGERCGGLARLGGDIAADGCGALTTESAAAIEGLLRDFLLWQPSVPCDRSGKLDLKEFAALLAPICRLLREDVEESLGRPDSPLVRLAQDWRQLLFPNASDGQFADAYAQTVTFALLLGRSEGADPLTVESAVAKLSGGHNLLSRALQVLTDATLQAEMPVSIDLLKRVIGVVPAKSLTRQDNTWLYFYEDFLEAYDPKLRKDAGAYYTPVEVVRAQVRLVEDLLIHQLGRRQGFADRGVITLDPAAGTATYLLGIIEHAIDRVRSEQGEGAVVGQATALAENLHGFEMMVGPYAVAELRVARALADLGASLPKQGVHLYLTDTLESPHAKPPALPFYLEPIAEQHAKALKVKSKVPVIVCIGNPPYDRHEAAGEEHKAGTGGWVRWGEHEAGRDAILRDFLDPAIKAGHGVHAKNLYNLYVYFWRWALWKVFEHETSTGPGIVSFISASSYLDGDAFCGMREHMRRHCDEIWILDLGGEGRGTRKSDNVFAIQTPVAIAIAMRHGKMEKDRPARVRHFRVEGKRDAKLAALDRIESFKSVAWQECPSGWQAPFRPAGKGEYFKWPLLTDLMPWQHSGCEIKRTWPIGHDPELLKRRWRELLDAEDRALAFKETRDRKIESEVPALVNPAKSEAPIAKLGRTAPIPKMERYAYRSFDRQWLLADSRLCDYLRPNLWRASGDRQIYFASSVVMGLGRGPAITATAQIPDRHYFAGRGGKDILPMFRDSSASSPNLFPCLLTTLGKLYARKLAPEDAAAYIYGISAHPAFTFKYSAELETRQLRVPITKDAKLFEKVRAIGARLLWLHTYGERFVPKGKHPGQVPRGLARCTKAVPAHADGYPEKHEHDAKTQTLRVGVGEFKPVSRELFDFEVSGLKVVQSWLKYRMKQGGGKKSSPLDDIRPDSWRGEFTTELLELLWVLEATLEAYPEQAELLEAVAMSPCLLAEEMPPVPPELRDPPGSARAHRDMFDELDQEI